MSQRAVPGDTLYGLKRASESVQLSLTSGSAAKGKKYLELATTRSEEVSDLLSHASAAGPGLTAAGLSARTASLVRSTLGSTDSDVRTGTALLTNQAVREHSTGPLATLTTWAPEQFARMQSIVAALPAGSVRTRAQASSALVLSALNRAVALTKLSGCSCLSAAPTDSLGPVPCSVCTSPVPATNTPAPGSSTGPASGGRSSGPTSGTGSTSHTAAQGSTGSSGGTGHSSSTNPLGTLPGVGSSSGGIGVGSNGTLPSTVPTSALPTLATSPPQITLSLPPLLSSASPTGAAGTSSTCALRIVIPGVLAINTCTGLYVSLG